MTEKDDEQNPEHVTVTAIQKANAGEIPYVYFNGFQNGMSNGDVMVVATRNSHPVAVINMSYTVAKTLAISLNGMVGNLEEATEQEIMTTHLIEKSLKKHESGEGTE